MRLPLRPVPALPIAGLAAMSGPAVDRLPRRGSLVRHIIWD